MQLTYRGISYNTEPTSITTVDSGLTATYRGVSYHLLKSNAVATLPQKPMMYRGIVIGAPEVTYHPGTRPAMG